MIDSVKLQKVNLPSQIEVRSFEIIDSEVPEPRKYSGLKWEIVRRMIHTSADFEMIDLVRFHDDAIENGLNALRKGCTILTDTRMAMCGIPDRRMTPLNCEVKCLMLDEEVIKRAKENNTTRAHAALEVASTRFDSAIHVIGNAPTALIKLVEMVDSGEIAPPALVVGMPVGFVNAAESKELLMKYGKIPYISLAGRKGGSPLAATVINALAERVLQEK